MVAAPALYNCGAGKAEDEGKDIMGLFVIVKRELELARQQVVQAAEYRAACDRQIREMLDEVERLEWKLDNQAS